MRRTSESAFKAVKLSEIVRTENTSVRREFAHAGSSEDAALGPATLVNKSLVNHLLSLQDCDVCNQRGPDGMSGERRT